MSLKLNASLLAACLVAGLACSGGGDGTDGGTDGGPQQGPCNAPSSQTLGDTCCGKYGASACTGDSFCSAFGGGTGTCTANGTQPDMSACSAAAQCASGGCNTSVGQCQSSLDTTCTQQLGCGPAPQGSFSYCDPAQNKCVETRGQCMDTCLTSADCAAPTTYCVGSTATATGACCYTPNSPCTCQPIQ